MPTSAADRPRRTYATGVVTRVLRLLAPLTMLVVTIVALRRYPDLPDRIVTHLGAGGEGESFGPRWSLLVFVAAWWLLLAAVTWLSGRPRVLSYPLEVTPGNAQDLYREGERMLVWLNLALASLAVGVVMAILGDHGAIVVGLSLAATVGVVPVGVVRLFRADGRARAAASRDATEQREA